MPEKVFIHAAYPLQRKSLTVAMARGKQLQAEGCDVKMTYCNASAGTCAVNYLGNPLTCGICKSVVRQTAKNAGLEIIPLSPKFDAPVTVSASEKKHLIDGVMSGLISTFRLMAADVAASSLLQGLKKRYYKTSVGVLKSLRLLIQQDRPDRMEVFNGRHACSKLYIIEANHAQIPFNTLEIKRRYQPMVFNGHTAHDRKGIQQRVLNHPPDFKVAEEFFHNRRYPQHNKFAVTNTTLQPPQAPENGRKITFFLSSQDEFAALGKGWSSAFDENAKVIEQVCRRFPNDTFCVRFHPNQADIGSDFLGPFHGAVSIPNLQLYLPLDPISSYELIDWSDLVITFGSTVTIEANWAGKPVILLGPSMYDELAVAETPSSMEELFELLSGEIAPRDRTNSARFVDYNLNDQDPNPYLTNRNGKIDAQGFKRGGQFASRVARYTDVAICYLLKKFVRQNQTTLSNNKKVA